MDAPKVAVRSKTMRFRVTPEEEAYLNAEAEKSHMRTTEYIRSMIFIRRYELRKITVKK